MILYKGGVALRSCVGVPNHTKFLQNVALIKQIVVCQDITGVCIQELNCAAQRTICYDGSVVSPLTPLSPPTSVSVCGGYSSKGLKDIRNCSLSCVSVSASILSSSLCVSIIQWGKQSRCLPLRHSPSARLSLCVAPHPFTDVKNRPVHFTVPSRFFLLFCFSPSFFPHSRLSLPLSIFHGCQRDICVLWMWSRGDVWMFWSRTVCLTGWIQTETYWFLVCDGIRS